MLLNGKVCALVCALFWLTSYSSAQAEMNPRYMVFTSDPQYPWTESSDNGSDESTSEKEKRSRWLIETQYSDIASFRKNFSIDPAHIPVMINGDMTAFGHGGERSTVRSIIDQQLAGLYDYGLGNHDYENNVDDCFLNNCAAGSIVDLKDRYLGKLPGMDIEVSSEGAIKKSVSGSLSYSRAVGDVHLVQLHNEPTYQTTFTAWDWGVPTTYSIKSSLDWLEQDLKTAREKGRIIILNLHKPERWQGSGAQIERFKAMIERYKVTAVFAGHFHEQAGRYTGWNQSSYFGTVPVFLSGAASNRSYLIAEMALDRRSMTVHQVSNNNWPSRKAIANIPVR